MSPRLWKWLVWGNLALRLLLVAYGLSTGHWHGSDTNYYLSDARRVCSGDWGGSSWRVPLYSWYLCATSLSISDVGVQTSWLVIPLFLQTFLVWISGMAFFRVTKHRLTTLFWLFEPSLLVYSALLMSDALFACCVLFVALCGWKLVASRQGLRELPCKKPVLILFLLGLALGFVLLMRPIGIPLAAYSVAMLGWAVYRGKLRFQEWVIVVVLAAAVVAPRVYWMETRHSTMRLSSQGDAWLESVAGVVEYYGQGLDFKQSEDKWFIEHKKHSDAYIAFARHFPTWLWLTFKGATRVLIGHVNVEWAYFITGESPIGPGWFKVPELREGYHVSGFSILPWTLGILFTALYCGYAYSRALGGLAKRGLRRIDLYIVWMLGAAILMAVIPQAWGDARFRAGPWPLMLALWAWV